MYLILHDTLHQHFLCTKNKKNVLPLALSFTTIISFSFSPSPMHHHSFPDLAPLSSPVSVHLYNSATNLSFTRFSVTLVLPQRLNRLCCLQSKRPPIAVKRNRLKVALLVASISLNFSKGQPNALASTESIQNKTIICGG